MMIMNMREFSALLAQFSKSRNAAGCTASEVETLERNLNASLPDDYKLFLRTCGHGVDDFMKGSDFKYGELSDLQEAAHELIDESNATTIPVGSFVFLMHQGYQFYFLNETGVYYYMEGDPSYEKRHDSFGEFFRSVVAKVLA
jgi:hypothetical protein